MESLPNTASLKKFELFRQFSKVLRKLDHVCFEHWAPILDCDSAVSVQSKGTSIKDVLRFLVILDITYLLATYVRSFLYYAYYLLGRGQELTKFADGRGVGVKNRENLP